MKLAKDADITVNLNHIMDFGDEEFVVEILNDNSTVNNMRDFVNTAIKFLR